MSECLTERVATVTGNNAKMESERVKSNSEREIEKGRKQNGDSHYVWRAIDIVLCVSVCYHSRLHAQPVRRRRGPLLQPRDTAVAAVAPVAPSLLLLQPPKQQ